MSLDISPQEKQADRVFAGRIDLLYALGRPYLSLPFAVLCVPATMAAGQGPGIVPLLPLMLQLAVVIVGEHLSTAYKNRSGDSTPRAWARRYSLVSALSGASWGVAALVWFVQGWRRRLGMANAAPG